MTTNNTNPEEVHAAANDRRTVYECVTDRIIDQLNAGVVPWRKPWRGGDLGAPRNLKSGQPYRGINAFLLSACAPFASPWWLTYRQAVERGGNVRKGEHGYPVVFWRWIDRTERDEQGQEQTKQIPVLRFYAVFSVEQCDGIEIPQTPPTTADFKPIERCESVLANMPQAPAITHNNGRAYYHPITDTVSIPHPTLFADPAAFYSTLWHELGHSSGHPTRLNRPGIAEPHAFGDNDYGREELAAEMTAAFLCGHCGIEAATIDNSAAYIAGWLKKLRDDNRLVITAAAQAQHAADFILGRKEDRATE